MENRNGTAITPWQVRRVRSFKILPLGPTGTRGAELRSGAPSRGTGRCRPMVVRPPKGLPGAARSSAHQRRSRQTRKQADSFARDSPSLLCRRSQSNRRRSLFEPPARRLAVTGISDVLFVLFVGRGEGPSAWAAPAQAQRRTQRASQSRTTPCRLRPRSPGPGSAVPHALTGRY